MALRSQITWSKKWGAKWLCFCNVFQDIPWWPRRKMGSHWYLDHISFPKTFSKSVQLHKTKAIVLILYLETSKQELFVREEVSVSVTKLRLRISPLLISSPRPHLRTFLQPWPTDSTGTKFPASQTRKCSSSPSAILMEKCSPAGKDTVTFYSLGWAVHTSAHAAGPSSDGGREAQRGRPGDLSPT